MADRGYPDVRAFPHNEDKGISLQEYVAARALQGILAARLSADITPADAAKKAVQYADALLVELYKKANG